MNHVLGFALMVCVACLNACAPVRSDDATPAWSHYTAYRTALDQSEGEPRYRDYLAESMVAPLNEASNARERDEIRDFMAFPLWLASTADHFEKEAPGGHCLTVNGRSQRGEPLAIAIRLKRGADGLRIQAFSAAYLADTSPYPERAHCPDEPILTF